MSIPEIVILCAVSNKSILDVSQPRLEFRFGKVDVHSGCKFYYSRLVVTVVCSQAACSSECAI